VVDYTKPYPLVCSRFTQNTNPTQNQSTFLQKPRHVDLIELWQLLITWRQKGGGFPTSHGGTPRTLDGLYMENPIKIWMINGVLPHDKWKPPKIMNRIDELFNFLANTIILFSAIHNFTRIHGYKYQHHGAFGNGMANDPSIKSIQISWINSINPNDPSITINQWGFSETHYFCG
jgi:hypothetical protein